MTTTMTKPRIAPGTVNYLTDLVRDRDVEPGKSSTECLAALTKWLAKPTTTQKMASEMIDRNRHKPRRSIVIAAAVTPPKKTSYPEVPEVVPSSKFAVLSELLTAIPPAWGKQEYLFFEVKRLHNRRVIRRLTGNLGGFKRSTLPPDLALELYGHLSKEAFAYQASLTFGEIHECCGRCGADLTDDQSRERQFGPICWDLMAGFRAAAGIEA